MMNLKLRKKISAAVYPIIVRYKTRFYGRNLVEMNNSLSELLEEYKDKKKIVVFCSGPSAKNVQINGDFLYLVTNNGYKAMLKEDVEYLLFLNDQFCVDRILANNAFYKKDQKILFYYTDSELHLKGWNYLKDKLHLLEGKKLYFFLKEAEYPVPCKNYNEFNDFYGNKNLEVKIQNSGMFLLIFGYYLADRLNLPLEIYGLDLGVGGNIHFDSMERPGESVTRDRVKINVKMYLDYIYHNHFDVKNYSNFHGNMNI